LDRLSPHSRNSSKSTSGLTRRSLVSTASFQDPSPGPGGMTSGLTNPVRVSTQSLDNGNGPASPSRTNRNSLSSSYSAVSKRLRNAPPPLRQSILYNSLVPSERASLQNLPTRNSGRISVGTSVAGSSEKDGSNDNNSTPGRASASTLSCGGSCVLSDARVGSFAMRRSSASALRTPQVCKLTKTASFSHHGLTRQYSQESGALSAVSVASSGNAVGTGRMLSRCASFQRCCRRKLAPRCLDIIQNKYFQLAMFVALIAALFLPDFWVVLDRPDNADLDIILTFVLLMFIAELGLQCIGLMRRYWGSFFFWMDLLGAASLLLDLSYLPFNLSSGDSMSNNVVIMRAARIAKLGARAGRFTKLVKLLRFLPGMRDAGKDAGAAKVISNRLNTALSTRVSCLIIVMVMTMPMFSMWTYPEQDWSMTAWLDILDVMAVDQPDQFEKQLDEFWEFYKDMDYYPYRLRAKSGELPAAAALGVLPWFASRGPPKRARNSVRHETASLVCDFSFKQPNQVNSLMNITLLVLIMLLMVGFSLILSNSVSSIVLRPLEKLLQQVQKMASTIFQSVTEMAFQMKDEPFSEAYDSKNATEENSASVFGNETHILERVVQKLTVLSDIMMAKSVVDAETMAGLAEGDRAVIHGFGGKGGSECSTSWVNCPEDESESDAEGSTLAVQVAMLESAGLSPGLLNSWNFNPLELDKVRNRAATTFFLGPQSHGITADAVAMGHFLETAEANYLRTSPYHNWFHAVDVTHCLFNLMQLCGAGSYLSSCERFSLLVSATCHDVAHPGFNNVFLVEAAHELAMRYNDKSPLENMHCSRLFEIVNMPKCNIFSGLSRQQFQEVRKCCIEAILHTDNAQHFPMIMEVRTLYEVNSEILDQASERCGEDEGDFLTKELLTCFRQPESRRLLVKLLLHFADVSNCMKPFKTCRLWAMNVLEEFFMQGDEEKRLGIPVQALNDREKVNRPFSQVGFIEFLVSPLVFAVIKVLPPTLPCADQMVQNLSLWKQCWLTETKPPPSETESKTLADRIEKLETRYHECHP